MVGPGPGPTRDAPRRNPRPRTAAAGRNSARPGNDADDAPRSARSRTVGKLATSRTRPPRFDPRCSIPGVRRVRIRNQSRFSRRVPRATPRCARTPRRARRPDSSRRRWRVCRGNVSWAGACRTRRGARRVSRRAKSRDRPPCEAGSDRRRETRHEGRRRGGTDVPVSVFCLVRMTSRRQRVMTEKRATTNAARLDLGRGGGRGGGVETHHFRDIIASRGGERLRDLRGGERGGGGSANRAVSGGEKRGGRVSSCQRRGDIGRGLADTHRHVVPAERLVALVGAFPAPLAVAPLLALRAPGRARVHRTTLLAMCREEETRARASFSELALTKRCGRI